MPAPLLQSKQEREESKEDSEGLSDLVEKQFEHVNFVLDYLNISQHIEQTNFLQKMNNR